VNLRKDHKRERGARDLTNPVARKIKNEKGKNGTEKVSRDESALGPATRGSPTFGSDLPCGERGCGDLEYAGSAVRGGVVSGPFWSGRESLNVSGGASLKGCSWFSLIGGAASGRSALLCRRVAADSPPNETA